MSESFATGDWLEAACEREWTRARSAAALRAWFDAAHRSAFDGRAPPREALNRWLINRVALPSPAGTTTCRNVHPHIERRTAESPERFQSTRPSCLLADTSRGADLHASSFEPYNHATAPTKIAGFAARIELVSALRALHPMHVAKSHFDGNGDSDEACEALRRFAAASRAWIHRWQGLTTSTKQVDPVVIDDGCIAATSEQRVLEPFWAAACRAVEYSEAWLKARKRSNRPQNSNSSHSMMPPPDLSTCNARVPKRKSSASGPTSDGDCKLAEHRDSATPAASAVAVSITTLDPICPSSSATHSFTAVSLLDALRSALRPLIDLIVEPRAAALCDELERRAMFSDTTRTTTAVCDQRDAEMGMLCDIIELQDATAIVGTTTDSLSFNIKSDGPSSHLPHRTQMSSLIPTANASVRAVWPSADSAARDREWAWHDAGRDWRALVCDTIATAMELHALRIWPHHCVVHGIDENGAPAAESAFASEPGPQHYLFYMPRFVELHFHNVDAIRVSAVHYLKLLAIHSLASAARSSVSQIYPKPAVSSSKELPSAPSALSESTIAFSDPSSARDDAAATAASEVISGRIHADIYRLLRRYQTLASSDDGSVEGSGFHAATPPAAMRALQDEFGVTSELFASPLNCYWSTYRSAFPDTDSPFGSLGSAFSQQPPCGAFQCNPPFTEQVISAMNHLMASALARSECVDESTERPLTFVVIVPHWSDPPAPFLRALIGLNCRAPAAAVSDAGAKAEPDGQAPVVGTSELPASEKHSSEESASSSIAASIACSSAAANPESLDPYRRRVVLLPAGAHVFVSGSQHTVDRTPRQSVLPSSLAPTAANASLFAAAHRSALIVLQNRAAFALRPPNDARIRAVVEAFCSH